MPAAAPPLPVADTELLLRLGQQLRSVREKQKVSASAAAEAAGVSRPTLHRIERGEPSVTMGAWAAVAGALGVTLALLEPGAEKKAEPGVVPVPDRIRLDDYPQLKQLAWQVPGVQELGPQAALELYERNWRHVDRASLTPAERSLVQALSQAFGGGRLLV